MRARSGNRRRSVSGQVGFTLVELAVTVAVIAIIASIAVPSFRDMLLRSRLTAAANEVSAAMQTAKIQALRTNGKVELCPSTDGATCSGTDWSRFIVRSTRSNTVLQDVALGATSLMVAGSSNIAGTSRVWFLADGFVRMGATATPNQVGTIGICAASLSSDNARDVQISMGRVSVTRVTRASCSAPGN
ncbi:pilus assembly FimT family protein [Thermomonas sp.]